MKVEIDAETFTFAGLEVNAEELIQVLSDPTHFYRFTNDGQAVSIEKYPLKDIEGLVR